MMSRLLYRLMLWLLLPYVGLHLWWRGRRQPAYRQHIGERFGYYGGDYAAASPHTTPPTIWLHAVSVGETRAAQPLIAALRVHYPDHRILLTHMTPTGRETSVQLFGDTVGRAYLPYDFPGAVGRFLDHFQPVMGILLETEIWPNLVAVCHERKIPLLLVNARLSEKSARGYARFATMMRRALRQLAGIAAQAEEDAARLRVLGAPEVEVLGNLKFDLLPPPEQFALGGELRRMLSTRPVLLTASTREGEEALILDALQAQPWADGLILMVPRHPQRFHEVAALVEARGLRMQRRSERHPIAPETQVLLGDSMGEMFAYYAACDVAFIGGTLLDYGGQNLIEACAVGAPVLIGHSTYNFAVAADLAVACGAALRVKDAEDLLAQAASLLADAPARLAMSHAGKEFTARHRGATTRTMALIARVMR